MILARTTVLTIKAHARILILVACMVENIVLVLQVQLTKMPKLFCAVHIVQNNFDIIIVSTVICPGIYLNLSLIYIIFFPDQLAYIQSRKH